MQALRKKSRDYRPMIPMCLWKIPTEHLFLREHVVDFFRTAFDVKIEVAEILNYARYLFSRGKFFDRLGTRSHGDGGSKIERYFFLLSIDNS